MALETIYRIQALMSLKDMISTPLSKINKTLEGTDQTVLSVSSRMSTLAKNMALPAAASTAVIAAFGSSIKTAGEFDSAIDSVGAVANASAMDMTKLKIAAEELGKSTAYSAVQVAEGQKYLAMAGFNTTQIIDAMPGVLNMAAAAQTDLGTTANIASNIMSGFKIEATQMTEVSNILTRTFTSSNTTLEGLGQTFANVASVASAAGASLSDVSAMAGILGSIGVNASSSGTHLKIMFQRLMAPQAKADGNIFYRFLLNDIEIDSANNPVESGTKDFFSIITLKNTDNIKFQVKSDHSGYFKFYNTILQVTPIKKG